MLRIYLPVVAVVASVLASAFLGSAGPYWP